MIKLFNHPGHGIVIPIGETLHILNVWGFLDVERKAASLSVMLVSLTRRGKRIMYQSVM
jgi:hypothetical protein